MKTNIKLFLLGCAIACFFIFYISSFAIQKGGGDGSFFSLFTGPIEIKETTEPASPPEESSYYLYKKNYGNKKLSLMDSDGYVFEEMGSKVTRYIHSEQDLPPLNGSGEHLLEAGTRYIFDDPDKIKGAVILTNPLRIPTCDDGYGVQLNSSSDNQTVVIYEGTGALLRGDNNCLVFIRTLDFIGNGSNKLFDLNGGWGEGESSFSSVFTTTNYSASDFAIVGDIKNYALVEEIAPIQFQTGSGVNYENINTLGLYSFLDINDSSGKQNSSIQLSGNIDTFNISGISNPYAGSSFLNIDPALDFDSGKVDITFSNKNGGDFLLKNETGSIISFSDNLEGGTTVTSSNHTVSESGSVYIYNSIGYDGGYNVFNVTANTFDIDKIFTENFGKGIWDKGSITEKDPRIKILGSGITESSIKGAFFGENNVTETSFSGATLWNKVNIETIEPEGTQRFIMTNDNELKYIGVREIIGNFFISLTASSDTALEKEIEFTIFKNNQNTNSFTKKVNISTADQNIAFPLLLSLKTDDIISLYIRNNTNTTNILVKDLYILVSE